MGFPLACSLHVKVPRIVAVEVVRVETFFGVGSYATRAGTTRHASFGMWRVGVGSGG